MSSIPSITNREVHCSLFLLFVGFALSSCHSSSNSAIAERLEQLHQQDQLVVQIAELVIDSSHLKSYLALLEEGIRLSVKNEPGVLTLYALSDTDNPTNITVMEMYASPKAYKAHINSPHFQKYKTGTMEMVTSLKLTRLDPVALAAKRE